MKTTPDYTEYVEPAGGEVRYYESGGKWRYVCAKGEGSGFATLEAAQAEVREFADVLDLNRPKTQDVHRRPQN